MISWGKVLAALLFTAILSGCGSNFEWLPKSSTFSNSSTATTLAVTPPGTVMREIPFPAAVKWASDIFFNKSDATFWMLAGSTGDDTNPPNLLVQIKTSDGSFVKEISQDPVNFWPYEITGKSNLAFDGTFFWITSKGLSGGTAVSEVFQILTSGEYLKKSFKCPATSTAFCTGLAWDSATASFWSAASDKANLVNYKVAADVTVSAERPFTNLWSANNVTDVSFDSATNEVFVIDGGVIRVNGSSGTGLGTIAFAIHGNGRGDWDGKYFWVVDNTSKSIKALFVR